MKPIDVPQTRQVAGHVGPRTLLFSDIEGSTKLLATLGDEYAGVLATYRAVIRRAISAHNGTEQSTGGDGFFVIFLSASDGLAAAIEAQRALRAVEWPGGSELRVRIGLHTGDIGWADGDVVGLAIHAAARIADAAHGGQVLVSSRVCELTAGARPEGVSFRTLGRHRLKDLPESLELFQALHPELPGDFPPPRSRDVVVDLPVPRTSFVGREREVAEILALLSAGRHVTLTGIGGAGKTRLALEVAARDAERHPDGVFFVDLSQVADPNLVLAAVAAGVNVQGEGSDLGTMLLDFLSGRRSLIVLDNCEHVLDACADVVDPILARCLSVHVLATSREPLRIQGEQTFRVPSLSVDDDESEAVQLWESRARAVRNDFAITDANRADVLSICRRLDGIPLAIELAAARTEHLSVSDISQRLDDRFELLVGAQRRRLERQQTLQAAIDWSWTLLTDDEQTMLRRLAVFVGPFTLEAAESVCGVPLGADLLRSLVSKSLVNMDEAETMSRFRLLETVRIYAQERLVEAGEADERRDAHRDWYLSRDEEIPFDALLDFRVVATFVADYANHRAALEWSASQDRPDLLARQVMRTVGMWVSPALIDERRTWLSQIGEDDRLPAAVRADAYAAISLASMMKGDFTSVLRFAERSVALDASDRPFYGAALQMLGRYDESAAASLRAGMPAFARYCRAWEAGSRILFDPQGALDAFLEIISELDPASRGVDRFQSLVGSALARLALEDATGALADARDLREALREFEAWGGTLFRYASILESLALTQLSRFDEARAVLLEVTRAVLRDRYPMLSHDCLVALAYLVAREGDIARAATWLEAIIVDGRLRLQPMYLFVGRFLIELRQALASANLESTLPTVETAVAYVTAVFGGKLTPDAGAATTIDDALNEFAG